LRLGVHVSIQGGLVKSLERARAVGCNTMQIFSRSPRSWSGLKSEKKEVEEFKKQRKKLEIIPLVVHIPYLANLASPDDKSYEKSLKSFVEDVKTADEIGAEYFVTHLGSHKGEGEEFGIKRFYDAMNIAIKETTPKLQILLETTAGSGDALGYSFEHIKQIIDGIKRREHIGICLDTAHVYAAGYDITTKKGLDDTLKAFDSSLGLDRLKVVHLNDSKSAVGSRVDRHENIGKGTLGSAGIRLIINHLKLKDLAFILETPKESEDADRENIEAVKKLCSS